MASKSHSIARSVLEFSAVFALYSGLTAIFFLQLLPFLHSSLIGPPEDNMQDFWNTWYTAVADRGGSFFYTNLIKFPEGTSLYYHSFAYPKVFAIWSITHVFATKTSTLILLQNISILVSFPLAGVGAFYLVKHFISTTGGALLGGMIYAFNPSHIAHALHHVHVSSIEFIPFFVLSYLLAARNRDVFWLALAIGFYCLNALSCWYYLFYIFYFIVFQTGYFLCFGPKVPRGWVFFLLLLTVAGTLVALSPLLVPMVAEALAGVSVYMPGDRFFVADLLAYGSFPPTHLFSAIGNHLNVWFTGNAWEATVYLGLGNLALLAWALVYMRKNNFRLSTDGGRLLVYVVSGMALFCVLASGASLHVLGYSTIPMPDRWLDRLPFFGNVRTPSRAIVFVYLFLAIGVGQAYVLFRQWNIGRFGGPIALGIALLLVLDFYPAHQLSVTALSCSPGFSIIRNNTEQDFGVLTLPDGYVAGNAMMMQQACHGRPIVQGNIARTVTLTLRDRLETADLRAQREQLTTNRVKYIVVNFPKDRLFAWGKGDGLLPDYLALYPVLYKDDDIGILQVY
jgi:hypothetical protein